MKKLFFSILQLSSLIASLSVSSYATAKVLTTYELNLKQGELRISLRDTDLDKKISLILLSATIGEQSLKTTKIISASTEPAHYFFLIDTSLTMRGKPIQQSIQLVKNIAARLPKGTLISIAGFDKSLHPYIESKTYPKAKLEVLSSIKANGKFTELYRLVKQAQKQLLTSKIERLVLVIFSDGKVEDTSYFPKEIIGLAQQHNMIIHSLGFKYSVHLQSLRRLSEESGGQFIEVIKNGNADKKKLDKIILSTSNGGETTFSLANWDGPWDKIHSIQLKYQFKGLTAENTILKITFPKRQWYNVRRLGISQLWWAIGVGSLVLILMVLLLIRKKRRLRLEKTNALPTCSSCQKIVDLTREKCEHCGSPLSINSHLAQLITIGKSHTQSWSITKARTTMGRMEDNDIIFESEAIGRWHANIQLKDGVFYIQDLGSANTTLLNDQEINTATLHDGDLLDIGELRLRFEINPEFLSNVTLPR